MDELSLSRAMHEETRSTKKNWGETDIMVDTLNTERDSDG